MEEYNEIDLTGFFARLLRKWKQIVLVGFIFGCIGIVSALLMKREYTTNLTLAPEIVARNTVTSSLTSTLARLNVNPAQLYGTDAINVTIFPKICSSTTFLAGLLDVPVSTYVSPGDAEEGVEPLQTTVYRHYSGEDKPGVLKKLFKKKDEKPYTGVGDPTELDRKTALVVKKLSRAVVADVENKTGLVTISVTAGDKMIAKQLADTVCSRLQLFVSDYHTRKAQADYDYYVLVTEEARLEMLKTQEAYAASVDNDRRVNLQSGKAVIERLRQESVLAQQIYAQLAQQREQARARIQEDKPAYAVIQPAVLPPNPDNSRVKRVLSWGIAGGLLAVLWFGFLGDFLAKWRKNLIKKMEEE